MGQYITSNKIGEILTDAHQQGIDPKMVMKSLIDRGHEIEGFNSEFDPFGVVTNAIPSMVEVGKGLYHALKSPGDTIKGIGTMGLGALQKLIPGEQDAEAAFDTLIDFMGERYGTKDRLLNTIERDPVGFLSDVSIFFTGGAGAAGLTSKAAKVAGLARVSAASGKLVKGLMAAAKITEPTNVAVYTARRINKAVGLNKQANKLIKGIMSVSEKSEFVDGKSIYTWLNDHGIYGSLEDIARKTAYIGKQSKSILDAQLKAIGGLYKEKNAWKLLNEMDEFIGKERNIPQVFIDQKNLVKDLKAKINAEGLTLFELNEVKRLANDIFDVYKATPSELGFADPKVGRKAKKISELRKPLRKSIENIAKQNNLPNVYELNRQIRISNKISKIAAQQGKATKVSGKMLDRLVNLLIYGGIGAGVGFGFAPEAIAVGSSLIVGRQLFTNPKLRTFLASRLKLMTDGDFDLLEAGIMQDKWTRKSRRLWNEINRDIQRTGIIRAAGGAAQVQRQQQQ